MKSPKVYLPVVAALAAAMLVGHSLAQGGPAAGTGPGRVAVCDIVQVFNNYNRVKDLSAEFEQKRQAVLAEAEKRLKAIDDIQIELDALLAGSEAYEKRYDQLQKLSIEHKAWIQYQEELVKRDHHKLTRQVYQQILDTVSQLAQQQGVEVVLSCVRGDLQSADSLELAQQIERRRVLYSADQADLTDAVLGRLNSAYSSPK